MRTLVFILLTASLCHGQVRSSIVLGVRSLAMASDPKLPERFVKTEDGFTALVFSVIEPGELTFALTTAAELPLFERHIDSSGKVSHKLADMVKLPGGAKGALLLGWMSESGPKYLAIDDNYLSAKHNDWLLINAAPKDVAFQIGYEEKPFLISANSVKNHRLNTDENVGVSVIGQAKWGKETKTFYSTYWPVRGGQRGIVIFYERRDRISVRRITDVLLKPEEKVTSAGVP